MYDCYNVKNRKYELTPPLLKQVATLVLIQRKNIKSSPLFSNRSKTLFGKITVNVEDTYYYLYFMYLILLFKSKFKLFSSRMHQFPFVNLSTKEALLFFVNFHTKLGYYYLCLKWVLGGNEKNT